MAINDVTSIMREGFKLFETISWHWRQCPRAPDHYHYETLLHLGLASCGPSNRS